MEKINVSSPLTPIHPDDSLIALKLEQFRRLSTDVLIASLLPGQAGALRRDQMVPFWMDTID
ncbi:MAG: hypothetical protein R2867_20480 [Caldilineaceae bacterium]